MVFPWILEQGGKYRDRVDKVRKEREDRLDAQRSRNRKKIKEFVKENSEDVLDFLLDEPSLPFAVLSPVIRPIVFGAKAGAMVGTWAAEKTIEAGGVGALDLFTPEIRRYEDTALVGMGGMII